MARYNPKKDPFNNGTYMLITFLLLLVAGFVVVAQCAVGH